MRGNLAANSATGKVSGSSPVLFGLLIAIVLILLGSVITSMLLHFSSIKEANMPGFVYAVNGLSLIVGGIVAGRRAGKKGWYYGGLTGFLYFLIMALVGFLAFDISLQMQSLYYLIGAILCGTVGGMIGINFK